MRRPRYYRADHSHCWYTRHWHLYLFWRQPYHGTRWGNTSGFTVKKRSGGKKNWRHFTVRYSRYCSAEHAAGGAAVRDFEIASHLSLGFKRRRVLRSKRYFRVKLCL